MSGPPRPRVHLRSRIQIRAGRQVVGTVRCARVCRVAVQLWAKQQGLMDHLVLRHGGAITLREHRRLRGLLTVTVSVDDGPPVTGKIRG